MNEVSLADYDGLNGFGGGAMGSPAMVDDLNKAISAGYDVSNQTGGGALRPQSLESTLKVLSFQDQHVKLWKKIAKLPAYSTVEEYNQLDDYGSQSGAFFQEGGLPREEDTTYTRETALVKFMGTTRVVTHPMTLVRSAHGDVMALEARNGTLWIMRAVEQALFTGSSRNNSLQFDGYDVQIRAGGNIIDAQGMPLSEGLLETGGQIVAQNFGVITDVFLSTAAMANLAKTFFPKERVNLPASEKGVVGVPITHFASQNGVMQFNPDVFIQEGVAPLAGGQVGAPNITGLAIAASAATGSGNNLAAGTYGYSVSAVNANGETVAIADGNADKTATAGQSIPLVITIPTATPTMDQPAPTAYKIYRRSSVGSSAKLYLTTHVPADDPNYVPGSSSSFTVSDLGNDVEGTSSAYFFDMNPSQVMAFKQLAPLMKLPLATISAAIRFMVLLYGVPILYANKKCLIVKNIGAYSAPVNLPA
jgi:hypothetical protein